MACNNNAFDISKYMIYIRDMDINEQDALNILQDVLDEIALDTRIFRDLFAFDIDKCDEVYDIKALYNLSQATKLNVTNVSNTDYTDEELLNILQGKEVHQDDTKECSDGDNQDSDNDDTDTSNCLNTYMNVIDLMWYNKNDREQPIKSVISSWFQQVGNDTYELILDEITKTTGISSSNNNLLNPLQVIGYINIIPNIVNLSSDDERLLRQSLISGLKYKISDMYLNTVNEQVSNLLYQRYYNAKKQLAFTFPQMISNQKVRNANWNI